MKVAIAIFFRSRNCYSALRKYITLPRPKTINSLFGNMGSPGSINECKDVANSVFSHLDGEQKYCKVLIDEVHVKPTVRYQGNQIIGFANDQEKPARTVLTLMVCPLLGAPAFAARLTPIYTINSDLLFEQINILIKIIHESSGSVFLVMNDNHSANIKCYDQFHGSFGNLNEFSTPHPIKNDTFNCLFLLYDPIYLIVYSFCMIQYI